MGRSNSKIRVSVSTDDVDRMAKELEEDLDEVIDETAQELRSIGLEAAKNHIRKNDRVWNREVLNGWVPLKTQSIGHAAGVTLYGFQNTADHAAVVDEGAVYTNKKPPVNALMPYVQAHFPAYAGGMTHRDWAFWLQEKIFQEGIAGIDYTGVAKRKMEAEGPTVLKKNARKNL